MQPPSRLRLWLKRLGIAAGAVVVVLGLAVAALGVWLDRSPTLAGDVVARVEGVTGMRLRFSDLSARLGWFGPELVFSEMHVLRKDGAELLAARAGRVGVDWFRMLATLRPAARVTLDGAALGVEITDAGVRFVGQPDAPRASTATRFSLDTLPTGRVQVTNAQVTLTDLRTGAAARGRPLRFDDVDIDLTRGASSLEVGIGVDLPKALGRRIDIEATLDGALSAPEALDWQGKLRIQELRLAGWRNLLPAADTLRLPLGGDLDLRLEASGTGAVPADADVSLELVGLVVPANPPATPEAFIAQNPPVLPDLCGPGTPEPPIFVNVPRSVAAYRTALAAAGIAATPSPVRYSRLAARVTLAGRGPDTQVRVRDLDVLAGNLRWQGGELDLRWTRDAQGLVSASLRSPQLRPAPLVPLAGLLPSAAAREVLAGLSPRGTLSAVDLTLQRGERWGLTGTARLEDVGVGPVRRAPGFLGVSGTLTARGTQGELTLRGPQFRFLFPQFLLQPEPANLLGGRLRWSLGADGLRLLADDVRVTRPDGRGEARARIWVPADGRSPVLSLKADVHEVDIRSTPRFLSATRINEKSIEWLDQAFVAGRVSDGTIEYAGQTRCFPFRTGGGEFRVRALANDATLHFAPGWDDLTHATAEVEIVNSGLTAVLLRGQLGGLDVTAGRGTIADFRASELAVSGEATGDLGKALSLVQRSPVGPPLGGLFNGLRGQGQAKYSTTLWLPLRDLTQRRIDVRTVLDNATVRLEGVAEPATGLRGELRVLDRVIETRGIAGSWLGGPLTFSASATLGRDGQPVANLLAAAGRAQGDRVTTTLRLPEGTLQGAFNWRFAGRLPVDDAPSRSARATYRVDTTLVGAAIGLPAPLGKPAGESRATRAELTYDDANPARPRLVTRLQVGRDSAVLEWIQDGGWQFRRGTARLGGSGAELKDASRLWVEGRTTEVDVSGWLRLKPPPPLPGAAPGTVTALRPQDLLRGADVAADRFVFMGYEFPRASGRLTAAETNWEVVVDGPALAGRLQVPFDLRNGRLDLDLERLVANDARAGSAGGSSDPRELPAMRIDVRSLEFEHRKLGEVKAELTRTADGLRLVRGEAIAPSFRMLGTGSWSASARGQECRVQLEAQSNDALATLEALAIVPALKAKQASAKVDVRWAGGLDAQFFERLNGRIALQASDGQVLSVEPGAGGRALGLLSLGALERRLTLDFRDLTGKGLAFDTVKGDFDLRDGNAYTTNTVLKGPAADIGIVGRTGLKARDYDQTVKVTSHLGGPIVAAGTLAGGPAIGAALLVFSRVFKEPLSGMSRGYYRITGGWDTPDVQRIGASEAKQIDQAREGAAPTATVPAPPAAPPGEGAGPGR